MDNQLRVPPAVYLREKGLDCEHVLEVGLAEASDAELCKYATDNGRTIISKDVDFLCLAIRPKVTFQLVWVRLGNCRTVGLIEAFEQVWPRVETSLQAGERVLEIR